MLENKTIKKILNLLLQDGADYSEIFCQKKVLNNLKIEDQKIENATSGIEMGCGLRIWSKNSTYYGFVDSLEKEKLFESAKMLGAVTGSNKKLQVLDLNQRSSPFENQERNAKYLWL